MGPQSLKLVVAHRGERSTGVKRAVKPTIVSHPGEHAAGHALRIKESRRVTEGNPLCAYPSDSAAAANQRIKRAADSGLEVGSGRPDDDRHFPPVDVPVVTTKLERLRLRMGQPGVGGEADAAPCLRCGQAIGDEPRLLVAPNEDRQRVSN